MLCLFYVQAGHWIQCRVERSPLSILNCLNKQVAMQAYFFEFQTIINELIIVQMQKRRNLELAELSLNLAARMSACIREDTRPASNWSPNV